MSCQTYLDNRGLEVCGHGDGPALPLDLHGGCSSGNSRHHPPGIGVIEYLEYNLGLRLTG